MKVRFWSLFAVFFLTAAIASAQAADPITGLWKSIDEAGKLTAYWEVTIVNDVLRGTIIHVPDKPANEIVDKPQGEFKNKPVIGTYWIYNMKRQDKEFWSGGTIVDPKSGNVYGCEMRLKDGGQTLDMRGFMGFSLLGRTQSWKRATQDEINKSKADTLVYLSKSTNQTAGN